MPPTEMRRGELMFYKVERVPAGIWWETVEAIPFPMNRVVPEFESFYWPITTYCQPEVVPSSMVICNPLVSFTLNIILEFEGAKVTWNSAREASKIWSGEETVVPNPILHQKAPVTEP